VRTEKFGTCVKKHDPGQRKIRENNGQMGKEWGALWSFWNWIDYPEAAQFSIWNMIFGN
jgi:hypothetical protein